MTPFTDFKMLIATRNPGKAEEVRLLLSELPLKLLSPLDLPEIPTVEETGTSYAENAILKASFYARSNRTWALADDSGLEVDALHGAPGLISSRYAGAGANDSQRLTLLLSHLSNVRDPLRSARFRSVIAVANQDGRVVHVSEGVCEGSIVSEPRGENGFGYDPVFVPKGHDVTFAQMSATEKDRISHRAIALRGTRKFLQELLRLDPSRGDS